MHRDSLNNVHIQSERVLITPVELKERVPVSAEALSFIADARQTIANIIQRRDHPDFRRIRWPLGNCQV